VFTVLTPRFRQPGWGRSGWPNLRERRGPETFNISGDANRKPSFRRAIDYTVQTV